MNQSPILSPSHASNVLRSLGSLEQVLWLGSQHRPKHFALAAEINGKTTIEGWRTALDAVQRRHPLLSVRIEKVEGHAPRFLQVPGASIPLRILQGDGALSHWESEMEREMSSPVDPQEAPLIRATLLHHGDRAVCILVAHHAIADGISVTYLIRDLLQALSGQELEPLPVPPTHEELLGITGSEASPVISGGDRAMPPAPPATYRMWDGSPPHIKKLRLTTHLTATLRDRARQEGTTVHGALSVALAFAAREISGGAAQDSIRICSPIDTRDLLGLGGECVAVTGMAVIPIEPRRGDAFWSLARRAKSDLAPARSCEGLVAAQSAMHQAVVNGIDVQGVAGFLAAVFAHDIMLSNLGQVRFGTQFGALRLEAVWGPAILMGFAGAQTVGVTTVNGAIGLLHTSYEPIDSLLEATEGFLRAACATLSGAVSEDFVGSLRPKVKRCAPLTSAEGNLTTAEQRP